MGLSLGSNVGDRLAALQNARDAIAGIPGVAVVAVSPVYETEPVDVEPEHRGLMFLNAVLVVQSDIGIRRLADELRSIEDRLGRERGEDRNAPRIIDIDVIYAGDLVLKGDGLDLPHPRWSGRRFVVKPLADVRPGLVMPGHIRTVGETLAAMPETSEVSLNRLEW